jgi:hypothetical protein
MFLSSPIACVACDRLEVLRTEISGCRRRRRRRRRRRCRRRPASKLF